LTRVGGGGCHDKNKKQDKKHRKGVNYNLEGELNLSKRLVEGERDERGEKE